MAEHFPPHDAYNRLVKSNHGTDSHGDKFKQRAGVIATHDHGKRDDKFEVKTATHLYAIKAGHTAVAVAALPAGKVVCANPAEPQPLEVMEGNRRQTEPCVMAWHDAGVVPGATDADYLGSGWIPTRDIKYGTAVAHAAHTLAGRDMGAEPTNHHERKRVRQDIPSPLDGWLELQVRYHDSHAKTVDRLKDYLPHDGRCNLSMNLPSRSAAPIACDVALPHEVFFVEPGTTRKVDLYHNGNPTPVQHLLWVYGCLGDGSKPDPKRRGWIPHALLID